MELSEHLKGFNIIGIYLPFKSHYLVLVTDANSRYNTEMPNLSVKEQAFPILVATVSALHAKGSCILAWHSCAIHWIHTRAIHGDQDHMHPWLGLCPTSLGQSWQCRIQTHRPAPPC